MPNIPPLTHVSRFPPPAADAKFTVQEFRGMTIYRHPAEPAPWPGEREMILERDALKAGDQVLVPGLTGGLIPMTIHATEDERLMAKSEHLMAVLEFGEDARNAWVCTGLINLRGVVTERTPST